MPQFACFTHRRALPLMVAILLVTMIGIQAYPQHSHGSSGGKSSVSAWTELQSSMRSMHENLSSIKPSGNDDEDFVQMMLPHHQAALDMAKVELMHGKDPQMRRLAQEIVTDQESEIELMHVWLTEHRLHKQQPASPSKEQ
jgi:uncharacterized protein (DUF305 family)